MFLGEYDYTLDSKNRLVVPAPFRTFLTDSEDRKGFFIIVSPSRDERCLRLYTMSGWKKVAQRLRDVAAEAAAPDELMRQFSRHAHFAMVDGQFRMVVPQRLIDYAGLEREVVIVGVTDWIEVWNPEEWNHRSQKQGPWNPTTKKDVFGPIKGLV